MSSSEDTGECEFCLLPPGTNILMPDKHNQVILQFPRQEDAIIFFEFLRSFVAGEITLEVGHA